MGHVESADGFGLHADGDTAELDLAVRRHVLARLHEWYGIDPSWVTGDRPLAELGLTSRDAVTLAAELSELAEVALPATVLWEAPTLELLARHIRAQTAPDAGPTAQAASTTTPPEGRGGTAIAVVGIGCRLPGSISSPDEFWRLLREGGDAVGTVPGGRWDGFAADGDPTLDEVRRHGGFLDDIAGFDAEFFGIPPVEAAAMDPQQRLLLEVAHEALDHAAIPACSLAGTRTGVFVGISGSEYFRLTTADLSRVDAWTPSGAALSIAANRLSYVLDLRGPSMAVDTACSSSLVAVHHAVRSLLAGECETALAAGVNALLSPAVTLAFQRAGALAPDGRCKAFDAAANGMVRAEGCGVVVLRRLADAERAGDRVLAVIRGTAVNSDGRSNGLIAPNAEAQRALLAQVYAEGGPVRPAELDYVETHGTGTPLGDPVEAGALGAVLGAGRAPDQPLLIGSVKTNLGHLEAAAGIAGLIKTVLALHHGNVPPQLHFSEPSPHIDFDADGLRVVTEAEPWPRYSGTATAGVSAFGFGGTNAHVLVQEYRPSTPLADPVAKPALGGEPQPAMLVLDAASDDRLREEAGRLAAWLRTEPGVRSRPIDVAHTLLGRIGKGPRQAAVVARTSEQVAEALIHLSEGRPHPATLSGQQPAAANTGAVWVFSGYGSQWPGMARRLLDSEPAFAAAIDRIEPLMLRHGGISLRAAFEPDAKLDCAPVVLPAIFGIQVALADLWRAHGLRPAAVVGHSMGEVAAAVVAGAIDEETGVRIMVERSKLLDGLSGGAMAVVDRSRDEIEVVAEDGLDSICIAVHSSPRQCVVAGSAEDVERLVERVTADGGNARSLRAAAAGHTAHVDPLLDQLAKELGEITHKSPDCRVYSTVLEDPRAVPDFDTGYWVRNLRDPVRFQQAITAAAADGFRVFVEVSPHPTQLYPMNETLRAAGVTDALVLPTLRRDTDESVTFRLSAAALLMRGSIEPAVARNALHPGARVVDVPSPRWRHRRFWVDVDPREPVASQAESPQPAALEPHASATADAAPSDDVRDRLRLIVSQVMGYSPQCIGDSTPLTELGLDSLHAVRVLAMVEHEFGVALPPKAVLREGTIATVSELLSDASAGKPAKSGVRPRDATERLIAQVWADVSGDRVADVIAPLTALTRDKNLAAEFVGVLAERIGTPPPRLEFDDAPSVGALADLIRPLLETPVEGPIRVLRAEGGRPPLYLIHPAGGSSAVYRGLVDRLDADQPVFGLERLPDTEAAEVTEKAAVYARIIRERDPDGPWAVGGWSFGGAVGQEVARLLSEHGTVSALVLIDTVLPLPEPGQDVRKMLLRRYREFAAYIEEAYGSPLNLPYGQMRELDDAGQIATVVEALRQTADLPPTALEHQRDSFLDLRSAERHIPQPYAGRTLLYRASEVAPHTVRDPRYERTDPALGWDSLCPDLTISPLPGHHLSLLDPPVVDVLARRLDADLRGA
ncbi:acyltransferase domain-containing protein [Actinospica sp. MGRD01-02]|uniref:Acyltransferase domain-containing protein n=1 Tax=Actinospica acidithermotolerans TaxID=2828514 RepID=A0A941ILM1_9ACTN|nr:type I polyketide synthase [Actinospica acidithermotolerans]MBR7830157.1 acyltransferase domain-containing protein [Actinospica acidithermotolerans]